MKRLLALSLAMAMLAGPASAYFKNRREVPAPPYGTWVYITECQIVMGAESCWEIKDFVDMEDEVENRETKMSVSVDPPTLPKYSRDGKNLSHGFGDFAGSK